MIQFIGKTAPVELSDVDALTGATVTTNAVITALNDAYDQSQGKEAIPEPTEAPAPTEASKPTETPKPTEAPKPTQAPSVAVRAPQGQTGTGAGEALIFFETIRAEAQFTGDTLEDFHLLRRTVGADAWEPMDEEQAYLEELTGKKMPLGEGDVTAGSDYINQAVRMALNQAYESRPADESGAVSPAYVTGEALIFFDTVRAQALFENDALKDLKLSRRSVGSDSWESMTEEEAYRLELIGKQMPLTEKDVTASSDYVNQAVLMAVNQAYENDQGGLGDGDFPFVFYSGEAVIFFDVIRAEAAFEGDTVAVLNLYRRAVGEAEETAMEMEEAYQALLTGAQLPLNGQDVRVDGDTDYLSAAVAQAVNQAYAQSLDRQQ